MTKNRRSQSGYPRGDDTRARVIAAALRLFGQHGFEGASTRDIAVAAGVNAPALQYYFSSKEGLYLACVEYMAARLWAYAGDATQHARELLAKRAGRAMLIDAFCAIEAGLADFMFSSQEPADWLSLIVREQAGLGPDAGFRLMYSEISSKLFEVKAAIVGRLMRIPASGDEARLRAATLHGQLLVFMFLRRTVLTALHWPAFHPDGVALIKSIVRENIAGLLHALRAPETRGGTARRAGVRPALSPVKSKKARIVKRKSPR